MHGRVKLNFFPTSLFFVESFQNLILHPFLEMHSHHSHSGAFCRHAAPNSSPSSMIASAIEKGFTHYNLTEHIPRSRPDHLYPEEIAENLTPKDLQNTFDEYIVEARSCTSKYADRIQVLVGAELENVDGRTKIELDFVEEILKDSKNGQWRIDYVVGSVHHVQGIPIDFDKSTFEEALSQFSQSSLQQGDDRIRAHLLLMIAYLDAQHALIQRFKPEVIGHFDLCRLFEKDTPMTLAGKDKISTELHPLLEKVDVAVQRNVKAATSYGSLFEINTASVRKGWPTPYPGEDVLDVSLKANCANLTHSFTYKSPISIIRRSY
jgi:histidinol-phosphatase (PHP family)